LEEWGKSTITAAMAVRQAYSQAESLTLNPVSTGSSAPAPPAAFQ
jgi:hypothetical protein